MGIGDDEASSGGHSGSVSHCEYWKWVSGSEGCAPDISANDPVLNEGDCGKLKSYAWGGEAGDSDMYG